MIWLVQPCVFVKQLHALVEDSLTPPGVGTLYPSYRSVSLVHNNRSLNPRLPQNMSDIFDIDVQFAVHVNFSFDRINK